MNVNSYHNFGIPINLLAKSLLPVAVDKSKNVEFLRHKYLPIFCSMFHPERDKKKKFLRFINKKITKISMRK